MVTLFGHPFDFGCGEAVRHEALRFQFDDVSTSTYYLGYLRYDYYQIPYLRYLSC